MSDFQVEALPVRVARTSEQMGEWAAQAAQQVMLRAVQERGVCRVIFASANSQLPLFHALHSLEVPWEQLELFHMDEYLGLGADHPASFSRFLQERLIQDRQVQAFHAIDALNPSPLDAMWRYDQLLRSAPIDLCCLGIGENGHLAFNEPDQADFHDPVNLKIVRLDEVSREQQVGEGHFPDLNSVPTHAITLTIPALLGARNVIAVVPGERKARAVQQTLLGQVGPQLPATALRRCEHARLFLDAVAAEQLESLV